MKFQVGDIVECCGIEGIVSIIRLNVTYPVVVTFGELRDTFTNNGLIHSWHTKPSLIFISRPKKKTTKHIRVFVNIYKGEKLRGHPSREIADRRATKDRIACVEMNGSYDE